MTLCTVLAPTQAQAKKPADTLFSWRSQVPEPFVAIAASPKDVALLAGEGMVFYPQPKQKVTINIGSDTFKPEARFVTGAVVLDAPASQVKAMLTDYASYPKHFPKLVSSDVQLQDGNLAKVKYRAVIDIPVPVLKFDETFVLRHQIQENSLSTWIEDSPVKHGMGEFRWYALGANKTLLTLTQWGDLTPKNLRGLVLPIIFKAMPELKVSVPHGINAYVLETLRLKFNGKDAPKNFTEDNITPHWQVAKPARKTLGAMLKHTGELPVEYAHPPRKLDNETELRFVSSVQYVPSAQDKVKALLFDPKAYPSILKQVKQVTTTPHKDGMLADTKIGVGLGVIDIPFSTKIYFHKPSDNTAEFHAAGGDVRWIHGRFTTHGSSASKTLMMTTIATKTDKNAPFLLRIAHALPYHDYLGNMGIAPLLIHKAKTKLTTP